ncbi:transposase family protein [Allorhodopirellula heiligendammensis]|uniref:transposase family protein n=1 Tax=Allorhodopirellula heiligendammensis TaxID=2714739 RepID=UPI0011B415BA|nr:transposase family protein [Allorhodopirellula heiligendammensis]
MAKENTHEFEVDPVIQDVAELPDPPSRINQRHLLGDMIVINMMAVIAGAEGPKVIGVWARGQ